MACQRCGSRAAPSGLCASCRAQAQVYTEDSGPGWRFILALALGVLLLMVLSILGVGGGCAS